MSLLQLPPELFIHIFNYVGSSDFRSDLSRLTICKEWYEFAKTACYREFDVTEKTLRRLMSSPHVESSLRLLKDSAETMDINLQGFEDWDSFGPPPYTVTREGLDSIMWMDARGPSTRTAWSIELNSNLVRLATILQQTQKLRVLRIQAMSEVDPMFIFWKPREYLFCTGVNTFLAASNLTSLELDLCGSRLKQWDQENDGEVHICTSVAKLLTTLRRLRLRMRDICAGALNPPHHSTNLRLDEVLVNLSLSSGSPLISAVSHARRCGYHGRDSLALKGEMEKQARDLVAQMAAPKTVRVLMHEYPNCQLRAFDVLTGKYIDLAEGAEWRDDGEVIKDQVSDEESEISSITSFSGGE
ncbi:hypothetical protein E8E13_004202 [Curvularia kusanoi]|uniref:F-box domain-containing protein n=1 Tax=Curvularia kusanoi TaxID=90978 RepID=A0A9P4TAI0_CURKU|nr:hypothetical protein E8E13_004202 [Curvularia kusanoi]